ncbi:hypothetical protein SPLC1_S051910 [Arthrospira platensis C1]|nr:hypothetical protein SPLC1_S051910 [Arthrospira platensis C1]
MVAGFRECGEMVRSLFFTMRVAGYIAYLSRLGGGTEPNTTISPLIGRVGFRECGEMVRSLFLRMMVAGYIAYLSRLGGVREPNTTISPLIGSGF